MVQRLGETRKGRRERIEKGSREGIEIRISRSEENQILEVKAEDWERSREKRKGS